MKVVIARTALDAISKDQPQKIVTALRDLQSLLDKKPRNEVLSPSPVPGHYDFSKNGIKMVGVLHNRSNVFSVECIFEDKINIINFKPLSIFSGMGKKSDEVER